MIRSMTAYARRDIKGEWGSSFWELRSVNHRYLDTSLRLPESFRGLEPRIRAHLRSRLTRGKVECNLHFQSDGNTQKPLILNKKLAKQLVEAGRWVKRKSDEGEINPLDILRWPGVMVAEEQDIDVISDELMPALELVLDDFIQSRKIEGEALKKMIEHRLEGVDKEIANIRIHMPAILQWQRERLLSKLDEAKIQLENTRLEQELLLIAQRIDVAEELERLDSHIKETRHILNKKEAVGRQLDFMMQEFNRESNTLASKSINTDVTNAAIQLKVLIEQMREQIQNIE
ncbi:hypothetical protein REG_0127 [Candidatus Regiella insecticola LSR1]|uniref:YicC family protein n=1 Tax=Candidatus Regiella insecticola LSR1 TaxID=663321 RepID=E0WQG3_9ENTR|nr:YicC/YloC family endoribonuclease [Candidatus Regiella insecticola]EFL92373.1 hypothetical protein REG_0127 [Candidatus Regiella insecticola LSR1]